MGEEAEAVETKADRARNERKQAGGHRWRMNNSNTLEALSLAILTLIAFSLAIWPHMDGATLFTVVTVSFAGAATALVLIVAAAWEVRLGRIASLSLPLQTRRFYAMQCISYMSRIPVTCCRQQSCRLRWCRHWSH